MADDTVYSPGALPVIKAIAEELGIVEVINDQVEWDEDQCDVSPGHRILAILMNFLTEGEPLYQLPEFFSSADTEYLFGEGITPDKLNDDALGRGLDKFTHAEGGPKQLLGTLLLKAAKREGLDTSVLHADTTSVSVQGVYEEDEDQPPAEASSLSITYGYSKDKRPDLKQYQVGLGTNRDGVPVVGEILDGDTGDSTWNKQLIGELIDWINGDEPPIYVADSKAVTKENLNVADANDVNIISRLPRTFTLADDLVERALDTDLEEWTNCGPFSERDDAATYRLEPYEATVAEQDVRGIVVYSSSLAEQKAASIDAEVEETEESLEETIEEFEAQWFACEPDAEDALEEWLEAHNEALFEFEASVVAGERKKSRDSPGRPPADWEPYETAYQVEVTVSRDEEAITARKTKRSCFVVLTTIPADAGWSPAEVLEEYKAQQTVERRFPLLKDPNRVGPVFLKNPDRIEALGYVLVLVVLVYSVIERRARQALVDADEPMALMGGKSSFRPTGRRVLERFENVMIMEVDGKRVVPANRDIPERVLDLLDLSVTAFGVESAA